MSAGYMQFCSGACAIYGVMSLFTSSYWHAAGAFSVSFALWIEAKQ